MNKKLLITRPLIDSITTKKKFEMIGIPSTIFPFIEIVTYNGIQIPKKDYELIIFTSKNAARLFHKNDFENITVFSIGDGTFEILKEKKYLKLHNSFGNSKNIISLFIKVFKDRKINILHPCGKNISMELQSYFSNQGSKYEKLPIYEVKEKKININNFVDSFWSTTKYLTLYSPNTAKIFKKIIKKNSLIESCKQRILFVLSEQVKAALNGLNFEKIYVSTKPSEKSLIELVQRVYFEGELIG